MQIMWSPEQCPRQQRAPFSLRRVKSSEDRGERKRKCPQELGRCWGLGGVQGRSGGRGILFSAASIAWAAGAGRATECANRGRHGHTVALGFCGQGASTNHGKCWEAECLVAGGGRVPLAMVRQRQGSSQPRSKSA